MFLIYLELSSISLINAPNDAKKAASAGDLKLSFIFKDMQLCLKIKITE